MALRARDDTELPLLRWILPRLRHKPNRTPPGGSVPAWMHTPPTERSQQ